MKLSAAREGLVVRNVNNGSHYLFERPEKGRIRIRPLELFPNGLLITKPTPTIVDPGLEVVAVGMWFDGMCVEGKPSHSRRKYETELQERRESLVELEIAYELLPVSGTGEESRGSWANKVKNCRIRIGMLEAGLADADVGRTVVKVEAAKAAFKKGDFVQMPSGLPAQVDSVRQGMASLTTKYNGEKLQVAVPVAVLLPWHLAAVATV